MPMKNTGGAGMSLGDIPNLVKIFVVVGVMGSIGLLIMSQVTSEIYAVQGLNESNASQYSNATEGAEAGIEGLGNIMDKLPLLGTILVLLIILGLVIYMVWRK